MEIKCAICEEFKGVEKFPKNKRLKSGFSSFCIDCKNNRLREWRKNNKDKTKEYSRKYAISHPDRSHGKYYKERKRIYTATHKEERRNYTYKRLYGISLEDYQKLYEAQNGACLICENKEERLYVDHCHKEGIVRGLLCRNCNTGIGMLGDNILTLEKAINYLKGK